MTIASANMVQLRIPFANQEATDEWSHGEWIPSWASVGDAKMDHDIVVQDILREGGTGMPLWRVKGYVSFLLIIQLWISDYSTDIRVWAAINNS